MKQQLFGLMEQAANENHFNDLMQQFFAPRKHGFVSRPIRKSAHQTTVDEHISKLLA